MKAMMGGVALLVAAICANAISTLFGPSLVTRVKKASRGLQLCIVSGVALLGVGAAALAPVLSSTDQPLGDNGGNNSSAELPAEVRDDVLLYVDDLKGYPVLFSIRADGSGRQ